MMFRPNTKIILLTVIVGLTLVAAAAVQSAVYNLASDFSTSNNPSNSWSYGYKNAQDGLWHKYVNFRSITDTVYKPGDVAAPANSVVSWYEMNGAGGVQNGYGCLYKNTSANAVRMPSPGWTQYPGQNIYIEPGMVANYTPGSTWQCAGAGVRWTAPSSGVVNISATFSMQVLQWNGQWDPVKGYPTPSFSSDKPQIVSILKNGAAYSNANLDGFAGTTYTPNYIPGQPAGPCGPHGTLPTWTYASDVTVAAGDTFDFLSPASASGGYSFVVGMNIIIQDSIQSPTFSPGGGTYTAAQSVTISTPTSGAAIRYTTDGTTPSATVGTVYSAPINISSSCTLKAIAYKTGMTASPVTTASYVVVIPTVVTTISDASALSDGNMVSITSPKTAIAASGTYSGGGWYICESNRTKGIKVTGGTASLGDSVALTGTISTDANGERAIAVASIDSIAPGTAILPLGFPKGSPGATGQLVRVWGVVTDIEPDYFLIDNGGGPVQVQTSGLSTPLTVTVLLGSYVGVTGPAGKGTGGVTVVKPRQNADIVDYINMSAPTFSPAAGTYTGTQSVTISDLTSGATIRYTTDGTTPSETVGNVYGGPVSISSSCVLKAIAYKTGMNDSAVTSGSYTIDTSNPAVNPVLPSGVPGQGIAGTVVVDDLNTTAVKRTPSASSHAVGQVNGWTATTYGGTVLDINAWQTQGDGNTVLTVTPTLPAGNYAVWVKLLYYGTVTVQVSTSNGTHNFCCTPYIGEGWTCLGIHPLKGSGPVLTITNQGTFDLTSFDAAAFVPTGSISQRPARWLPPATDDYTSLQRNCADQIIGPTDTPVTSELMAEQLSHYDPSFGMGTRTTARQAWDNLNRSSGRTFLWLDSNTTTLDGFSYTLTWDADRLAAMAAAWAGSPDIYGEGMRGNPILLQDTLNALDWFVTNRFTATTTWNVNWWDYEIGAPRSLLDALTVLGPNVSDTLKAKVFAAVHHQTDDPRYYYNKGGTSTGANRVWMCALHLRLADLERNASGLAIVRDALDPVFTFVDTNPASITSRDGWWIDGSFVQHGNMPYVGAYGVLLIPPLVDVLALLDTTPWVYSNPLRANLPLWIDNSVLPVMADGAVFPRVTGRTAGSSGMETCSEWDSIAMLDALPLLSTDQQASVRARLKRWMNVGGLDVTNLTRASFREFVGFTAISQDSGITPAGIYEASRVHAATDSVAHHRNGWAASIAMSSTRVCSHESIWGANKRGWNQGEGVLMVYPSDPNRYFDGYWCLVDPYRLPGITTNTWSLPDADGSGFNPGTVGNRDFAGGVSLLDRATVAAMRVGRSWSSLDARKGWFCFDNAVVCLGSGITASDGRMTETIVEAARLDEPGTQALSVDGVAASTGTWNADLSNAGTVFLAGTTPEKSLGWWFPQHQAGLTGIRERRTANWSQVMTGDSTAPITRSFLTLKVQHGNNPSNGSYQYVVLPGISQSALTAFASSPTISVLSCTPSVQGVTDTANGWTGAIFWDATGGSVGGLTADHASVALVKQSTQEIDIAVSDPTQKLASMVVTFNASASSVLAKDPVVTVQSLNPIRLSVNMTNSLGHSVTVRFSR